MCYFSVDPERRAHKEKGWILRIAVSPGESHILDDKRKYKKLFKKKRRERTFQMKLYTFKLPKKNPQTT